MWSSDPKTSIADSGVSTTTVLLEGLLEMGVECVFLCQKGRCHFIYLKMNTNSILAYENLDLTKAQAKVYDALRILGEASMNRVSEYLGVPKHTISGRFGEMVRDGSIEVCRKTMENGSTVGVYRIKKKNEPNWEEMRQKAILERDRAEKTANDYKFDEGLY